MKKKLFAYFLLTIVFSSAVSITVVMIIMRGSFKKDLSNTLKSMAYAIDQSIADKDISDFEQMASFYSLKYSTQDMGVRITFIDPSGVVMGESGMSAQDMENHSTRSEVAAALTYGYGSSIRYSDSVNMDMLYTAIMSDHGYVIRVAVPLKYLSAVNPVIYSFAVFSALVAIIISMLLAYFIAGYITKPLNEFAKTSLEIYDGSLEKRVSVKTDKSELGTLAFVFNNMADKLQNMIEDLKDENIKVSAIVDSMQDGLLFVDSDLITRLLNSSMKKFFGLDEAGKYINKPLMDVIRNRKINHIAKEAAKSGIFLSEENKIPSGNKDLVYRVYSAPVTSNGRKLPGAIIIMQDITDKKKLEQIRSDFVSNVTHEMKTPLTSIRGFIETLKNGAIDERPSAERFLDIIDIEASRLSLLINDILTISEIEQGITDISKNEFGLRELTDEVISSLLPQADKKQIHISNEIPAAQKITTDATKLKQILINIIENAIKYNNEGGHVSINTNIIKGLIEISISDNGIGIDDSHIDRIFERFYRVDKGRSREEGSTGLGLSIAKHLTKLLGGDIKVKSEPGSGSVFTVTLHYKT